MFALDASLFELPVGVSLNRLKVRFSNLQYKKIEQIIKKWLCVVESASENPFILIYLHRAV